MSRPLWPRDTIAWRFGVTIVASMAVSCGLIGLFWVFGGVWARPPVDQAARQEEATAIIQMLEAAPPATRETLVKAVVVKNYRADWYPETSSMAVWLDATDKSSPEAHGEFGAALGRTALVVAPGDPLYASPNFALRSEQYPDAYFFSVKLADQSWVVFTGFGRYWGLGQTKRLAIWLAFVILSFAVVSAIATRQLSRPIRHFASAVRRSGTNPGFPPIALEGPQELRDLIAAFNEMQAQIQEFVTYRVSMLAAISHDLRTPLTRLRLRGEFIADKMQQSRLFRDVDDMQAMIDGALAIFRGDADEEAPRAFDLAGILQSIADDYADQAIEIPYAGPVRLAYLGRPLALKRAFANLVENAVKYGTAPQIEVICLDKAVTVTIRDRGPGIPDEALEKVFRPFYRLDKSRNRATGGVGLGLTSTQAIIRRHGGRITLRNHPEGGLEAIVMLI